MVGGEPIREPAEVENKLRKALGQRVVAVTPNYLEMNGLRLNRGRFISNLDNERFANVAVLGAETAEMPAISDEYGDRRAVNE